MFKRYLIALLLSGVILPGQSQPIYSKGEKGQVAKSISASKPIADELDTRIRMVTNRLVFGDDPKLTEDFILACVTLDPSFARRFTEFSGDQCGRYLSAFSRIQVPGNPVDMKDLVSKLIRTQKPDGRFGNDKLIFDDPMKLEGLHMALLWGNGRLLTGLMDFYAVSKDPAVLNSAVKLGDFLLKTAQSCTKKEVVERFKTMGAMGYICFTQITDGLVKLFEQTSDKKYLENAATIYPLLPPLGNQHSHGFLNTLLGVMRLYQVTREPKHLAWVEGIYQQVIDAPDFLVTGGVPEFFDASGPKAGSRDEGCSEADFIMVSLELWKATGKAGYLEKAEYCLYNELMYNQFDSGDFGSHPIEKNFGFGVANSQGRCWWCCDYHGLQAMLEARKIIVTATHDRKQVNLFAWSKYKDADLAFTLTKASKSSSTYTLTIDSAGIKPVKIAFRNPSWANLPELYVNGHKENGQTESGYFLLDRVWTKGDQVKISFDYLLKIISSDRHSFSISEMPALLKKGAIRYGPYLLSADDITSTAFLAEPAGGNQIYLPAAGISHDPSKKMKVADSSNLQEAYLAFDYKHEGYYTTGKVILRPVSEAAYNHQANVQVWFNFTKK